MKILLVNFICLVLINAVLLGQNQLSVESIEFEPVDVKRDRQVPVKVYFKKSAQPKPVILFSHGLGGSRENSPYLGNHWAESGYVVVYIQHLGSDESVWKGVPLREIKTAMKDAVTYEVTQNRFIDVPFVLDQLELWSQKKNHVLHGQIDLKRIGMAGHSYGAVTTQAMMGQAFPENQSFADTRIRAFIPMSPSISKSMAPENSFGKIKLPVLCMTGTKDASPVNTATTPGSRKRVYQSLPAPDKYHLVFKDGEHFAFGQSKRRIGRNQKIPHHHPAILTTSTLFWDAYLKDDSQAQATLQSDQIRQDAKLVPGDIWQWK